MQLFAKIKSWRYLKQKNDPVCASSHVSRYSGEAPSLLMQTNAIKNQMSLGVDDRRNNENIQRASQLKGIWQILPVVFLFMFAVLLCGFECLKYDLKFSP